MFFLGVGKSSHRKPAEGRFSRNENCEQDETKTDNALYKPKRTIVFLVVLCVCFVFGLGFPSEHEERRIVFVSFGSDLLWFVLKIAPQSVSLIGWPFFIQPSFAERNVFAKRKSANV